MPTAAIDGLSIFYREFGDPAAPPLIALHGLYGDSTSVATLAAAFTGSFRVVAPDAIGHGHSAHPSDFTLEGQGRMLIGLCDTLGLAEPTLLGISMGAYLAAQAAVLAPARWGHLVLVVGKAHGLTSSSAAYAQRKGFDLASATPEEALAFLATALWARDTTPERQAEILAQQPQDAVVLTPDERAAVERSLAGFDLRPRLPEVTTPTLVLSGRDDGLNPPELGEELAGLIPGSRFEVYEHSGHMLPYEETDRLAADVARFVLS